MSEDVVHQLALLWDLGKVVERSTALVGGGFRHYVTAGSEKIMRGLGRRLRIDVVGPPHIEGPEGGPAEPESKP